MNKLMIHPEKTNPTTIADTEWEGSLKTSLRRLYRNQRRSLSRKRQAQASVGLARSARNYRPLFASRRILSYSPISGEINPQALIARLNSKVYLPKIVNYRTRRMLFLSASGKQQNGHLGISEPCSGRCAIPANHLDMVLLPLLAFDRSGNRLGMGGGFYDQAFNFRLRAGLPKRPLLVGVAHHFQETESVPCDSWDVPLDAIITDRELILV